MSRSSRELQATAYHEAGHAVAAYLLRRGNLAVSIVPDDENNVLGWHRSASWGEKFSPDVEVTTRTRLRLEAGAMVCFAGPESERRFRGRKTIRGLESTDVHRAVDLIDYIAGGDPEALEMYLGLLQIWTRNLLERTQNWAAVEALASALLDQRYIGGRDARDIIRKGIRDWINRELVGRGESTACA